MPGCVGKHPLDFSGERKYRMPWMERSQGVNMAKFVEPKSEKPTVLYVDEHVRVVKRRTQIHTGEWNKELIVEAMSGTDALGGPRWIELNPSSIKNYLNRVPLHELQWATVQKVASIICEEEKKDDYDYIYYLNKGRYRVKGEPKSDLIE
jgi:endonuclease III